MIPLALIVAGFAASRGASPLWRRPLAGTLITAGWLWNAHDLIRDNGWALFVLVHVIGLALIFTARWAIGRLRRPRWTVHRAVCQVCGEVIEHPAPEDLAHHARLFHPDLEDHP